MIAVITCELPVGGRGKITPSFYFPPFTRLLTERGITHYRTQGIDQLRKVPPVQHAVVILIYNETDLTNNAQVLERVRDLERYALDRFGSQSVIHPTEVGLKIGDKVATNRWLSAHGIAMPTIVDTHHATTKTFSNKRVGSAQAVQLLDPGSTIDARRYNTNFIDTAHEYRGRFYYVSLRTMCVGRRCVAAYVRMKPVEDGASVHVSDMPRDLDLLNYFHHEYVTERMPELVELSAKIGEHLGLGFYAHDILPETRTRKLYLCETGYKFDGSNMRNRLRSMRTKITFHKSLFEPFVEDSTKAFLEETVNLLSLR